jgi:hypothetical protein
MVAAAPLALLNKERRITIEAPVCPYLLDHLRDALHLLALWNPELTPPVLESPRAPVEPDVEPRRAAFCMSGGVDSLAALADNHGALPPGHRERFQDGIFIFGLNTHDFVAGEPVPPRVEWYRQLGDKLREFCARRGVALVPVATNIRSLYADWPDWLRAGPGATLAAVAHAMPRRLHSLTIATAGNGVYTGRIGTEPLLDPLYSSYSLSIRAVHASLSRMEKIRMIASDDDALAVLQTCFLKTLPPDGALNCGRCEKCVRTMLALESCGALDRSPTFASRELSPEIIESLDVAWPIHYRRLVGPLRERGRDDLARMVERKLLMAERERMDFPKSLMLRVFRGR